MANKMTGHEKIAAKNIKGAFNWEFGGMYNAYLDGEEEFPTLNEMKDMVYDCAMNDDYRSSGSVSYDRAPKEMRFAGEEFCRKYIDKLFEEDPDVNEVPWASPEKDFENEEGKDMENRRDQLNKMTVKELRAEAKEQGIKGISKMSKDDLIAALTNETTASKVHMYAFTGMYIGEFEADFGKDFILVNTASKGELQFDAKTGKEVTSPDKARYANRVERA